MRDQTRRRSPERGRAVPRAAGTPRPSTPRHFRLGCEYHRFFSDRLLVALDPSGPRCAGDRQDLRGGLPPPYANLIVITIGLLIRWPTIVIVFTCSIRVLAYVRLARREEREVESKFEEAIEDRFSLTRGKIAAYATGMGAQGKEKRW